jgi:hypothetical protein
LDVQKILDDATDYLTWNGWEDIAEDATNLLDGLQAIVELANSPVVKWMLSARDKQALDGIEKFIDFARCVLDKV